MDTIQIEITNACVNDCSNCTRFCGHFSKPFFMPLEKVKDAIDSLSDFPHMVGIMGGEPLLHPDFEEICLYLQAKRPRIQCGLWSTFPKGFEKYAPLICDTFGNVLLNDHSMKCGIPHQPVLTAIKDYVDDDFVMWGLIERCWLQHSWSASINQNGAFFCEIAAALSVLWGESNHQKKNSKKAVSWAVEKNWWKKNVIDFTSQMRKYCPYCGIPLNLRPRFDNEKIDDISESNLKKITLSGNLRKLQNGGYKVFEINKDQSSIGSNGCSVNQFRSDLDYFSQIAQKYQIQLKINEISYLEPILCDGKG